MPKPDWKSDETQAKINYRRERWDFWPTLPNTYEPNVAECGVGTGWHTAQAPLGWKKAGYEVQTV